jgi:CRISPR-associated protein Cst1
MRLLMGDWLMNAGILGYIRIQENSGNKINFDENSIYVNKENLEGFTDSYFTSVTMRLIKRIFRINILSDLIKDLEDSDNRSFRQKFKELQANNYNKIIPNYKDFNLTLSHIISQLKTHKEETINMSKEELSKYNKINSKQMEKIENRLVKFYSENIMVLDNKNLNFIYIFLNNFYRNKKIIGNTSIGKEGRFLGFHKEYVKPAIEQLENKPNNEGFLCRFCKTNKVNPKKFDDVDNIFAEGMFSSTSLPISFKNFYYNLQADLFICNLCELFLICSWIGFTEIPYRFQDDVNDTQYIFVNVPSLPLLIEENRKIHNLYIQSEENVQGTIYQDIIQDVFLKEKKLKSKWALKNILFVELKTSSRKDRTRPNFRYFHIGEDIAELFIDEYAIKAFNNIRGTVKMDNGLDVYIRRNLVMKILTYDSFIPLCYNLIKSYLSKNEHAKLSNVFNISIISSLRDIIVSNIRNEKNILNSNTVYGILKRIKDEGRSFSSMDYDSRKRKSYILLSMIRNGKIDNFYDILIRIYMSQNKPIPDSLLSLLNPKDELSFQSRAYSFMSGFLENNINSNQQE